MLTPLPGVEATCSLIQQEESQREVLTIGKFNVKAAAMFSRGDVRYNECGNKGYGKDHCGTVIGYPHWHPKAKQFPQKVKEKEVSSDADPPHGSRPRWDKPWDRPKDYYNNMSSRFGPKSAANVCFSSILGAGPHKPLTGGPGPHTDISENTAPGSITFTQQQFEQLLRALPSTSRTSHFFSETDDELYMSFAAVTCCLSTSANVIYWILDSGATDHMTPCLSILTELQPIFHKHKINLPNGQSSVIATT